MLPLSHQHCYEEFKQALGSLRQAVIRQNSIESHLKPGLSELQQFFQTQVLSLDVDELDSSLLSRVQSYQVEFDKQLRLLSMDIQFLQAARQPSTMTQRQQHVLARLDTLIRYCNILLGET